MFNTAEIFRAAHAKVRAVRANGAKGTYAGLFQLHLRNAWRLAKLGAQRAKEAAMSPAARRIKHLEAEIYSEGCRNRLNRPRIAALQSELAELRAAA